MKVDHHRHRCLARVPGRQVLDECARRLADRDRYGLVAGHCQAPPEPALPLALPSSLPPVLTPPFPAFPAPTAPVPLPLEPPLPLFPAKAVEPLLPPAPALLTESPLVPALFFSFEALLPSVLTLAEPLLPPTSALLLELSPPEQLATSTTLMAAKNRTGLDVPNPWAYVKSFIAYSCLSERRRDVSVG
jgi:hypothetical protein